MSSEQINYLTDILTEPLRDFKKKFRLTWKETGTILKFYGLLLEEYC